MIIKQTKTLLLLFLFGIITNVISAKNLFIVTTTTDLHSITKELVRDSAKVVHIGRGNEDIHYLDARPDYILKTSKADLFLEIGLDLEIGWVNLVKKKSGNRKISSNSPGFCDVSRTIEAKEKLVGIVDKALGHVHPRGNPHYWLDPVNGIRMANYIKNCLIKVNPSKKSFYNKNYQILKEKLQAITLKAIKLFEPYQKKNIKVSSYHAEFIYLLDRLGLKEEIKVEGIPGVAPSPARIAKVIKEIKEKKISLILASPWNDLGIVRSVAKKSGVNFVVLPIQTKSHKSATTYLTMLELCINTLKKALDDSLK